MEQQPGSAIAVEVVEGSRFEGLAEEWDRVVEASGSDQPFFRHAFLRNYLAAFDAGLDLTILTARDRGRLVAALPLVRDRARLYGMPAVRLRLPANVHSCRADLACEAGRKDALEALADHLAARGGFDVVELADVPPEGHARALAKAAAAWCPSAQVESCASPFIPLDGGWAAVERGLDAKFRSNLRRRRRRLEARGTVTFERCSGERDLERLLDEGFALESSGWKGREGTAIDCAPQTRAFYVGLARQAAARGELALCFLRFDGRAIAFHLGLVSGGAYRVPKLAYDESLADCAPGHLLLEAVVRDCCERGLTEFDFLGPSMAWKLDWTGRVRVHHRLRLFAPTARGRALHALSHRLVPAAKRALRWARELAGRREPVR